MCLRSSPIYPVGSVGFTVTCDGIPKVGQLMKAAWSLTDTCRFKIRMPAVRLVYVLLVKLIGYWHKKCCGIRNVATYPLGAGAELKVNAVVALREIYIALARFI